MKKPDQERLFANILASHKNKIYRLCHGYLADKNEVDDLFQEIMVNIWRNIASFRGEAQPATWVYRVAVNTALLYNKKLKKQKLLSSDFNIDVISDNAWEEKENQIEKKRLLQKLQHGISELPAQDRLIITLVLEGLTYKEISEITGLTGSNTGVKINRIKSRLEKKIKDYNE